MKTLPWRSLLMLIALTAPNVRAALDHLPFSLSDSKSHWRLLPLDRDLSGGLKLEAMIVGTETDPHVVVISAPRNDDDRDTIEAFSILVRTYFSHSPVANLTERDDQKIGFQGRDQHFDLVGANAALSCELFIFTDGQTRWGVLQWEPKSQQVLADAPLSLLQKKTPLPPGVVGLPAFRITDHPVSSFPVGFRVVQNPITDRITKIIVTEIPPDSLLDRAGIKPGDEIVSVDGRKAQDFGSGIGKNSDLGKIFLNRDPGSAVELEIISATSSTPRSFMLTNGSNSGRFRH